MADYQFGLPDNDPNYKLTQQKKLEEEQQEREQPVRREGAPVVKNQAAIKRGGAVFPLEPPPDLVVQPVSPEVAENHQPDYGEALPPTAGKLPFFEPEQPRKTRKVRAPEAFDEDLDVRPTRRETTRPRRSMSNQLNKEKGKSKAKQTIGDALPIAHYYLAQVQRVLFSPSEFFNEMSEESDLTEAAVFMGISLGVCAILQLLCGNFWAIFQFIGHVIVVLVATGLGTYALKHFEPELEIDFKTVFEVLAYSQAPKLIAWISMGFIPLGYIVSTIYSLVLATIGLHTIFGMSKMKSAMIITGAFMIARAFAWFFHLL